VVVSKTRQRQGQLNSSSYIALRPEMLVRSVFSDKSASRCHFIKLKAIFSTNILTEPYNHISRPPIIIGSWKGAVEKQSSANQTQVPA
jgi:hypothetical protein